MSDYETTFELVGMTVTWTLEYLPDLVPGEPEWASRCVGGMQ